MRRWDLFCGPFSVPGIHSHLIYSEQNRKIIIINRTQFSKILNIILMVLKGIVSRDGLSTETIGV
jgi:hypothetical protein